MNERFRDKIWRLATRNLKMGYMLPRWAIWLRCFLFPLDSFYWKMSGRTGYQMPSDSWLIDGIMYHRAFFEFMENANGELVRITRVKGPVSDLMQVEETKDTQKKYEELLMAVQNKFLNETRHETALRYIMEREARLCGEGENDL